MIHVTNSKMRLQAAARLMNEGNSMEYSAGVYSLPVRDFSDYLSGLFAESPVNTSEIIRPSAGNIEPPSFQPPPVIRNPLSVYSPLAIFPYDIVATGDQRQPDYQVIGRDLTLLNSPKFGLYNSAYEHAILCLAYDERLVRFNKGKE